MGSARLIPLLLLAALPGCGEAPAAACTEIGCLPASAQVLISGLPDAQGSVKLCAADRCRTVRGPRRQLTRVVVDLPETTDERVRVRIVVRSGGRVVAHDAALFTVETLRPNGPDCPPVCRFARGRLDIDTGRLMPS